MPKILKYLLFYTVWIAVAFVFAFVFMRIVLGPSPEEESSFWVFSLIIYNTALLQVGTILGTIISGLGILTDWFYSRKRFKEHSKKILIRFLIMLSGAFLVVISHYTLEKIIDVI